MKKQVIEADHLSFDVLNELLNDRVCVLVVRKYASPEVCINLSHFFINHGKEKYTHEIRTGNHVELFYYGVDRFGYPLNSTYADDTGKNLKYYLEQSLLTMRKVRNAAHPYLSPIDKLRVELDEIWPHGSNLGVINGHKTFCGIGRTMPANLSHLSAEQPHFDAVLNTYFPDILRQYAANIYLNVPKYGGELEIWDIQPIDLKKVNDFRVPNDWRRTLPASIKIKPRQGDLLLFNTCRPHAITKFDQSSAPRTSIQTFIGLDKNFQLFLWD